MSRPAPGLYVIYNRVLSPNGEKLAITYNGNNKSATVTPKANSSAQIWKLDNSGSSTMSISPQSGSNLQAAWGNNVINVMDAGNYVWTIMSTNDGFTIQDGGKTANWNLQEAKANANVGISGDQQSNERFRWVLEKTN